MDAVYRGTTMLIQPRELHEGGWKWDLTLFTKVGSIVRPEISYGTEVHSTREDAEQAAFEFAKKVIDGDD